MPLKRGQFSPQYSQKTPHSPPVKSRYGVSLMDPASGWYSASVPVIIYVISYNIEPRYIGTRMYTVYYRPDANCAYEEAKMLMFLC